MGDKQFCGIVKVVKGKYGDIIKLSFPPDALQLLNESVKESGWANLEICESKAGNMYSAIDEWEPNKPKKEETDNSEVFSDDVPF